MKKLNKLQINPERIMKSDELITLKGGYGWVRCFSDWGVECGSAEVDSCSDAEAACRRECGSSYMYPICINWP